MSLLISIREIRIVGQYSLIGQGVVGKAVVSLHTQGLMRVSLTLHLGGEGIEAGADFLMSRAAICKITIEEGMGTATGTTTRIEEVLAVTEWVSDSLSSILGAEGPDLIEIRTTKIFREILDAADMVRLLVIIKESS